MLKTRPNRRHVLGGALAAAAVVPVVARAASTKQAERQHVVLVGDSIFDNGAYVGNGPDVVKQLRERLPNGSQATLVAVDGSVTSGAKLQLLLLPEDATHIVVSAGGNDALHNFEVLNEKTRSVSDALDRLAAVRDRFAEDYRAMLDAVAATGLPAAVCTIYDPRFPNQKQRRQASVGLSIFNECITREASARGLALIDLRLICTTDQDLANPIEPSAIGGAKIANAIAVFAAEYDWRRGRSEVFAETGGKI
jgi:lysophospholipase L1-like esterase